MKEELRIAWFSPLNSVEGKYLDSPSAYVSEMLLPLLRGSLEIELFHADFHNYRDLPTFHYLNAFKRHQQKPFDIFFYNLEDHARTNFVRSHLGLIPGIVYFHDYLLTTFGPEPILNSPFTDVVKRFSDGSHAWPDRDKKYERSGPHAVREAALAAIAIFSNERNLNEWSSAREQGLSQVLPETALRGFCLPYPVECSRKKVRPEQGTVAAFCGSPRLEHRAHKALKALSKFKSMSLKWLVSVEERPRAADLLTEFNLLNAEIIEGRSPQAWSNIVKDTDVAIHLLFSAYGQSDPYLSISLAAGLPCLVTDFGNTEYLPDDLVFKIEPGEREVREIEGALKALVEDGVLFDSDAVRSYSIEHYDTAKIANELRDIFYNSADALRTVNSHWQALQKEARLALLEENSAFMAGNNDGGRLLFARRIAPVFQELGWNR